jgi:hypothetical protein
MDAALVVAIMAAVFAGLAASFAGWSARSAHRSAELADEAVKLERDRHHHELRPHVALAHDGPLGGDDEGVWFTNAGPLDYASMVFELTQASRDRPIIGLILGDGIVTVGDIGPLAVGDRRFLPLRRSAPTEGAGPLHLRLHCRNDQGTWKVPAEVEISGVPHVWVG